MFFMPSQTVRLYEGQGRVRDVLYNKKKSCDTNTGEWLGRQRSAARMELKTEATWGEFLE